MVMMQMRPSYSDVAGRGRSMGCAHRGHIRGNPGWSGPTGTGQRCLLCGIWGLPASQFGHPPNAPTAQPGILIAVPPAIHRPLDKASLPSKTRIQFRQSPSDRVAFRFVDQSVAAVLVFVTACPGIYAVLRLKLGRQLLHIDRFHIAPDLVFHLDSISRILKRNPLHTVVVLAHYQRCRRGNRSGCCIRIRPASAGRAGMQRSAVALRAGGRVVTGRGRTRGRSLQRCRIERSLHSGRLHFRPRAVRHAGRRRRGWGRRRMLHRRLSLLMRHEHRLRSHIGVLWLLPWMLGIPGRMHLVHGRILIAIQAGWQL